MKLGVDLTAEARAADAEIMPPAIAERAKYLKLPDLAAPLQGFHGLLKSDIIVSQVEPLYGRFVTEKLAVPF